ncbi:MAG TPA: radical SAM protein, partial [Thermoanaerobaculaceae bacterium]|nr:radical SAM protein [Thermoanaerobaculaceae bacterium]
MERDARGGEHGRGDRPGFLGGAAAFKLDVQDAELRIITEDGHVRILTPDGQPVKRERGFLTVDETAKWENGRLTVTSSAPNGTLVTPENAREIKASGIARCSISIDAPTAADHDDFRGVPGAFEGALRGIEYLKSAGMEFQINTTVTRHNMGNFKEIFKLADKL